MTKKARRSIKVKDIEFNPFRRDLYPIYREKVEALKRSITETSFWDNLLARPHPTKPGTFELAYGHHRLVALQELGIEEIDIPVRDLDDAAMIKIMADENMEQWKTNPAVVVETVFVAAQFLDRDLKKHETWKAVNMPHLLSLGKIFRGKPRLAWVSPKESIMPAFSPKESNILSFSPRRASPPQGEHHALLQLNIYISIIYKKKEPQGEQAGYLMGKGRCEQ